MHPFSVCMEQDGVLNGCLDGLSYVEARCASSVSQVCCVGVLIKQVCVRVDDVEPRCAVPRDLARCANHTGVLISSRTQVCCVGVLIRQVCVRVDVEARCASSQPGVLVTRCAYQTGVLITRCACHTGVLITQVCLSHMCAYHPGVLIIQVCVRVDDVERRCALSLIQVCLSHRYACHTDVRTGRC